MVRRLRRRRRRRSLGVRLFWRVRNGLFNTARGLGFIIFSSVRRLFEFPITGMRNLLRRVRNYLESTKNTAVEEKKVPTVKRKKVARVKKKKVPPALEEKKVSAVEEKKISTVEANKVLAVEEKKITAVEETKVPTLEDKPEELDQEEMDALKKEMDTTILEQLQMMEIGINSLDGDTEELFGTEEQAKQYLLRRNEMKDLILLQQLVDASIEDKLMMHKTE